MSPEPLEPVRETLVTPTILIVDDHVALAQGFAMALERAGYRAMIAHSAEFALHEAQICHPAAIILDFQMPLINGVGFLYRLRADPSLSQTPVLVVTGQSLTEEVQSELRQLGADVRMKPIGVAELLIAIAALVRRAGTA
jgi:DNA-binding response OmpR family regulator